MEKFLQQKVDHAVARFEQTVEGTVSSFDWARIDPPLEAAVAEYARRVHGYLHEVFIGMLGPIEPSKGEQA